MKKMSWLVKYWTLSLTYGLGPVATPYNLKHINGSGLGGSYSDTLINSWLTMSQWTRSRATRLRQWSSTLAVSLLSPFRQYPARHRATGGQRQSRIGAHTVRIQREEAWANYKAFLELKDPSTVGIGQYPARGDRAYRKLSPSLLNKETKDLVRRYAPQGWLDD